MDIAINIRTLVPISGSLTQSTRDLNLDDINHAFSNGEAPSLTRVALTALSGYVNFYELKLALNRESDPIDKAFVILHCIIINIMKALPEVAKETAEFKYLTENLNNLLSILQEITQLTNSARKGDFKGYEVLQILSTTRSSAKLTSKYPFTKVANYLDLLVPSKIFRVFVWNILNYRANDFTRLRRITYPLFRLASLPEVISRFCFQYRSHPALYYCLQDLLHGIANVTDNLVTRGGNYVGIPNLSEKIRVLESSLTTMDKESKAALAQFIPLFNALEKLTFDTNKLSTNFMKEIKRSKRAFNTARPFMNLAADIKFNGINLTTIKGDVIEVLTASDSLLLTDRENLQTAAKKLIKCGVQLEVAKRVDRVATYCLAPLYVGLATTFLLSLAPGLQSYAPFSYISHPVSAIHSCTLGLYHQEPSDCLKLHDDSIPLSRVSNQQIGYYALQHAVNRDPQYRDQSFGEALDRITPRNKTCPSRLHTTLKDTSIADTLRNPVAAGIKRATGYYPEAAPSLTQLIYGIGIGLLIYDLYNMPPLPENDAPLIKTLGAGARTVRALRKGPINQIKRCALRRANKVYLKCKRRAQDPWGNNRRCK